MDSLGVGMIEIGCIFAPDRQQCCQEVPKCFLMMPAWFLHFLAKTQWQRGHWDPLCLFQGAPQQWGVVKGKNHKSGSCPLTHSGTFSASSSMGLVAPCRGIIYELVTDMEDAKKVLLCPGNVVRSAKREPMMLLGHGSTVLQLPCRRQGHGGGVDQVQVLWVSVGGVYVFLSEVAVSIARAQEICR